MDIRIIEDHEVSTLPTDKVVGILFSASWCPPCKAYAPIISKFQTKLNPDKALIVKYDADSGNLAQTYEVSGLPTLIFISQGRVILKLVGLQSESDLIAALTKAGIYSQMIG